MPDPAVERDWQRGAAAAENEHPEGSHARLYRRLSFGPPASFTVLDGRQYRSDQLCGDTTKPPCEEFCEEFMEERTILGAAQELWFDGQLRDSRARWNITAN
jgi:alkaline phosphatase D